MIDDGCVSAKKIYMAVKNHPIIPFLFFKIFVIFLSPSSYLCAAAVAAASIANCLMVLSSRYFCSHLVMSASRARIRSSFSLSCCCNVDELSSEAVGSAD